MPSDVKPGQALKLLHEISLAMVRENKAASTPDFTLRQLAVLLTVYLDHPPHTVRGLARKLGVTKPVITRALDAMGEQAVVARRRDDVDRRNVIVQRTVAGTLYVETLGDMVNAKAQELL